MTIGSAVEQIESWDVDRVVLVGHSLGGAMAERTKLPEPRGMYTEPVQWATTPRVPTTYVKLLRDKAVSPSLQDRSIAELGDAEVATLDTGPMPMLGAPEEVASIFETVAGRAGE